MSLAQRLAKRICGPGASLNAVESLAHQLSRLDETTLREAWSDTSILLNVPWSSNDAVQMGHGLEARYATSIARLEEELLLMLYGTPGMKVWDLVGRYADDRSGYGVSRARAVLSLLSEEGMVEIDDTGHVRLPR